MIYNTEMKSDENNKTQTGQDLMEILKTREVQIQKLKAQIELLTETNRKQAEDMVMLQKRQSELQCKTQSAAKARELEVIELKKKLDEANMTSEKLRINLETESRKKSSQKEDREQAFEPVTEVVWVMWNNFKKQYNALRSEIDWAEDNMKRHFSAQRALLEQHRREMRKFLEEADDLLYQDDGPAELEPVEEFNE